MASSNVPLVAGLVGFRHVADQVKKGFVFVVEGGANGQFVRVASVQALPEVTKGWLFAGVWPGRAQRGRGKDDGLFLVEDVLLHQRPDKERCSVQRDAIFVHLNPVNHLLAGGRDDGVHVLASFFQPVACYLA